MSRARVGMMAVGAIAAGVGLVLSAVTGDQFLGFALLLVGAFLIVLPMSRPSLDE